MNKNKLVILSLGLVISTSAIADQAPTITCTGKKITLTTRTPYLGENSKSTQTLYILKSNSSLDESKDTAYFLDVDAEGDVDKFSMLVTVGKNNKGGQFTLKTKFWEDQGDGTITKEVTTGVISYKHGNLNGENESVECVKN